MKPTSIPDKLQWCRMQSLQQPRNAQALHTAKWKRQGHCCRKDVLIKDCSIFRWPSVNAALLCVTTPCRRKAVLTQSTRQVPLCIGACSAANSTLPLPVSLYSPRNVMPFQCLITARQSTDVVQKQMGVLKEKRQIAHQELLEKLQALGKAAGIESLSKLPSDGEVKESPCVPGAHMLIALIALILLMCIRPDNPRIALLRRLHETTAKSKGDSWPFLSL
jgi:hypothetical protein